MNVKTEGDPHVCSKKKKTAAQNLPTRGNKLKAQSYLPAVYSPGCSLEERQL